MSNGTNPSTPPSPSPVSWADPARQVAFDRWLGSLAAAQGLDTSTLVIASADASFRRYLRIQGRDSAGPVSRIIMDAPPDRENSRPFVDVARLMAHAGLNVPKVLDWHAADGFMLLGDLGDTTMMAAIDPAKPEANLPLYLAAVDTLIDWQRASRPGVLPNYDAALLNRELALFPDWYLAKHRAITLETKDQELLNATFKTLVEGNLKWPSVFVHRDFMPRNLMVMNMAPTLPASRGALPPEGALFPRGGPAENFAPTLPKLGVLDFQDAVYGPITYDIASLMRDAFLTWEEEFVLEVTIRYWEKARKAALPVGDDFGEFYKGVEWMGLQRHLKVAGIFARLTLRDGKPKYLADTPRFIRYILSTTGRYIELKPFMRLIEKLENIPSVTGFAYGRV